MMGLIKGMRDITLPFGQLFASLYVIKRAFDALLVPLKMFARMVMQAAEAARKLYASSIQSGFGMGMTVRRSILAETIGVSENDIFQFGRAIDQLNGKLSGAMKTIADTAPALTATGWNIKAMEINFRALKDAMAEQLAPEVNKITNFLSEMAQFVKDSTFAQAAMMVLNQTLDEVVVVTGLVIIAFESIALALKAVADSVVWAILKINNELAKLHVPGFKKNNADAFEGTKKGAADIWAQIKTLGISGKESATPQAYMKQMPASAWERMGLIVGAGGGTNYGQQTANNTKPIPSILKQVLSALVKMGRDDITRAAGIASAP